MDDIVAKYRWTVEELITARRWHYRHTTRLFFRAAIWVFGALILLTGICLLAAGNLGDGAMLTGFGCLILFGLAVGMPWLTRRQFRQRTDQNNEVEWRIKPEKMQIAASHSRTETDWKAFHKIVETPDGYLLYLNPQMFQWLPRHGFANDADFARIPQLAAAHGIQVLDVQDKSIRQRFRFQTKNILWAMSWICIWAASFSFLKTFVIQHRPLNGLPSWTLVWAVFIPLFLVAWTPPVAFGALFGHTRRGAIVGLVIAAICLGLALAVIL